MIANWVRAGNIQVSYVIDKAREDWRRVRVQGTVHVVVKGRDVKRLLNGNVLDELRTDFGMELVEHKFVDYDVKEYLFLKFRVDKVFEPFFNVHEFERGLVERFLELFFCLCRLISIFPLFKQRGGGEMEVLKVDFKKIKGVFRDVKKIEVGAWNDEEEGFFNLVVKGTTREGGEKYLIVHVERVPREEVEVRKEWWRRVKYSVGYDWRVIEVKFFEWDGEVWERVIAFKEYGAVIVFGDVDGVEREDWVKDMVDDFVVGWGTDYMDWLRGKQDRST